jgi:hypothetical protein
MREHYAKSSAGEEHKPATVLWDAVIRDLEDIPLR